ncbi:MAG: hypothetical protein C4520_09035 [Candidatus Abyssobacteria bacterium SURF_5]|uniref:B box-type domain-containing protein n=1 Tax=Abyssobacteria bacterium (strain SURF_5) TaxID=2093360 RepID=A0A3A4NSB6_ABYX5|nr:MAG: hypothetical protein C4520_09035 [Candidatus Abyssubacteria bacterium SURF_5]
MAQAPSRCINHPERTAVARCKQCHKPLCEKCVKKMPGGVYCGDECFQNMNAFQNRVKQLEHQKKKGLNLGKWIPQAAILLLIVALLYYVFMVQGVRSVDGLINMVRNLIP